ncbi:MAG: imidazolonepropionase [Candidatus Kapaibacterium sp.]
MVVRTLFTNISELVTISAQGKHAKVGADMGNLNVHKNAAMLVSDTIEWIGESHEIQHIIDTNHDVTVVNCRNKCIIPGFVDSHTHIVFAGNRSNEFARRLQGVSYQQIASEGGGILATMRAVRQSSVEELYNTGKQLALSALRYGTTTIEIKSGYGLSVEAELNQLRAIKKLQQELPVRIVSTFLGAHDFPPEYHANRELYIDILINQMIPLVVEEGLAEYCDVFADTGYYTIEQSRRILTTAQQAGLKLRVHADELTPFGAAELAAELHAHSADHLLYISQQGIDDMRNAGTVATLLPGTAYTLRLQYAPARTMIDANNIVALATDCNPGSCFMENMQQVLSLACMNMKMSIEESLTAATLHGANALRRADTLGSLELGKQADFCILDTTNYADLVYHFGVNHIQQVWIAGKQVI